MSLLPRPCSSVKLYKISLLHLSWNLGELTEQPVSSVTQSTWRQTKQSKIKAMICYQTSKGDSYSLRKVSVLWLVAQLCLTLCNPTDCSPPGSSARGGSPGKNTGVGCHALLRGIFSTQALNPGLSHCRQILYQLSHQGSQKTQWISPKWKVKQTDKI